MFLTCHLEYVSKIQIVADCVTCSISTVTLKYIYIYFLQKKGRDFDKFKRALDPNEFAAAMNNLSSDQRLEFLEKQFQECVDEYRAVVERLARD